MKVESKKVFSPVVITFESPEEVNAFSNLLFRIPPSDNTTALSKGILQTLLSQLERL